MPGPCSPGPSNRQGSRSPRCGLGRIGPGARPARGRRTAGRRGRCSGSRAGVPGPAHTTATSASSVPAVVQGDDRTRRTSLRTEVASGPNIERPPPLLEQPEVAADAHPRPAGRRPRGTRVRRARRAGARERTRRPSAAGISVWATPSTATASAIAASEAAESRHTSPDLVCTGRPSRPSNRRSAARARRPSLIAAASGSATRQRRVGPLDDDHVFPAGSGRPRSRWWPRRTSSAAVGRPQAPAPTTTTRMRRRVPTSEQSVDSRLLTIRAMTA